MMTEEKEATPWHKNSRFWRVGVFLNILAFALSLYLKDHLPFTTIASLTIGGGGAVNGVERWKK